MRIAVIGGANIDIGGFSRAEARLRDSNPGIVRMSPGGVGRNIAANLTLLGADVELITALGGDDRADMLRADCERIGVGLHYALSFPEAGTSTCLYIANVDGDMLVAVNDMAIHESVTPEALVSAVTAANEMDLAVIEANLPARTLAFLSEALRVSIVADAVSAAKVERLAGAIPRLSALKPNRIEAERLTGIAVSDERSARNAAEKLVRMGAASVYLTMGEQGVCAADASGSAFLKCNPRPMANATGAGDAFTAAIAWATARHMDLFTAARAGMAAASIAVESAGAVNPEMSEGRLRARISEMNQGG